MSIIMVSSLCSSLFILDELFDIQRDIGMKYKLSSNEFSEGLMKHYSSNICHILYSLFDDKFFNINMRFDSWLPNI